MNNSRVLRHALFGFGLGACAVLSACASDPSGIIPSAVAGAPGAGSAGVAGGGAAGQPVVTAGSAGSSAGEAGSALAGGGSGGTGGSASGAAGMAGGGGSAGAAVCPGAGKSVHFQDDLSGTNTQATHLVADLMTDLPIADGARTIEMWLYMEGKESWKSEHSIIEYGASGRCQAFGIDGGDNSNNDPPQFDPFTFSGGGNCRGDDNLSVVPAPSRTGWVHLAWSYDPTGKLSYLNEQGLNFLFTVNGVPQPIHDKKQNAGGMLMSQQTKLYIGSEQAKADPNAKDNGFTGKMDEVRIWNVARTAAELSENYKLILKGTEAGLVAYYHFDEGTGTIAKDSSTKKHDATFDTAGNRPAATWVDSTDLTLTCKP